MHYLDKLQSQRNAITYEQLKTDSKRVSQISAEIADFHFYLDPDYRVKASPWYRPNKAKYIRQCDLPLLAHLSHDLYHIALRYNFDITYHRDDVSQIRLMQRDIFESRPINFNRYNQPDNNIIGLDLSNDHKLLKLINLNAISFSADHIGEVMMPHHFIVNAPEMKMRKAIKKYCEASLLDLSEDRLIAKAQDMLGCNHQIIFYDHGISWFYEQGFIKSCMTEPGKCKRTRFYDQCENISLAVLYNHDGQVQGRCLIYNNSWYGSIYTKNNHDARRIFKSKLESQGYDAARNNDIHVHTGMSVSWLCKHHVSLPFLDDIKRMYFDDFGFLVMTNDIEVLPHIRKLDMLRAKNWEFTPAFKRKLQSGQLGFALAYASA